MSPSIDIHAHAIVPEAEAIAPKDPAWSRANEETARATGAASTERNRILMTSVYRQKFADVGVRLRVMDAMRIDIQAVPPAPLYHYWADRELSSKIVTSTNEGIAASCAQQPNRLVGFAMLSMQYPQLAVVQLDHAIRTLKLKGAIISTHVNKVELAHPQYDPLWSRAEELGALMFMHPAGCTLGERTSPFYLSNLIGNPADTTIALAHLVFGGVFDRVRAPETVRRARRLFSILREPLRSWWRVRLESHTCKKLKNLCGSSKLDPNEFIGGFERLAIVCGGWKCRQKSHSGSPMRRTANPHRAVVGIDRASSSNRSARAQRNSSPVLWPLGSVVLVPVLALVAAMAE